MRLTTSTALALGLALGMAGCMQMQVPAPDNYPQVDTGAEVLRNLDAACVRDYRPDVDYFPQRTRFSHSIQLEVEYGLHYKRLRFTPSIANGESLEFLLVQCGAPVPAHDPDTTVVQVPLRRLVTGNRSMLGALVDLGLEDRLLGVDEPYAITVPALKEKVQRGEIHAIGGHAHGNIEPIIAARPDVYLTFYSSYPQFNMHPQLRQIGIRAIPQADHLELHPLGRAEWLKLLALLTNREAMAEQQFAHIEKTYQALAAIAAKAPTRPQVMAGFASGRDEFELFGGANQRARLISDAGGEYVLSGDTQRASLYRLPFETVYLRGEKAPIWIGAQVGKGSLDALLAANPLHSWFQAARDRRVYAYDKGYAGAWAYPYNDQGMTRPHVALAELLTVLHPELARRAGLDPDSTHFEFLRALP